jgi:hypothetical protein
MFAQRKRFHIPMPRNFSDSFSSADGSFNILFRRASSGCEVEQTRAEQVFFFFVFLKKVRVDESTSDPFGAKLFMLVNRLRTKREIWVKSFPRNCTKICSAEVFLMLEFVCLTEMKGMMRQLGELT